jgi:hypothetical protein
MKKKVVFISIIILVALALCFIFFYTKSCKDKSCFNASLSECKRASYINDAQDASWLYKIKGKWGGECKVYVKLLQLKQGPADLASLEGKKMDCYLPLGSTAAPQENLAKCSGLLKEEMQGLLIKRLHNYITENLGEIGGELEKPI